MASMGTADDSNTNPATQTLLCTEPFEVLRLIPGVFQPDEIKRQYRRLALILHPDKNRHNDAEAAFKKLTAAFEKLHDPIQQARCRAEAERAVSRSYKRNPSAHSGDSSSHTRFTRPSGGGSDGGATGRAGGGDAPRWCREGEYVPEKKREEETAETGKRKEKTQKLWEDFEHQEKVFKEEVAHARELAAEKKRAKAEARERKDQERMDRLRESVLGRYQDEDEVEAKTASWQRFSAKAFSSCTATRKKQKTHAEGGLRAKKTANSHISSGSNSDNGINTAGVASDATTAEQGEGTAAEGDLASTRGDRGAGGPEQARGGAVASFVCWVCRRGFKSANALAQHEAKSELHLINVQLKDFLST